MDIKCIDCGRTRTIKTEGYKPSLRCQSCTQLLANGQGYINGLKKCTVCKKYLTLENFFNDKGRWDMRSAFCKNCNKIKTHKYYHSHLEKYREILYKSMRKHEDRQNARVIANQTYPERQLCETKECKEIGERHHDDYSKPKEIRWLCKTHHKEHHRQYS